MKNWRFLDVVISITTLCALVVLVMGTFIDERAVNFYGTATANISVTIPPDAQKLSLELKKDGEQWTVVRQNVVTPLQLTTLPAFVLLCWGLGYGVLRFFVKDEEKEDEENDEEKEKEADKEDT